MYPFTQTDKKHSSNSHKSFLDLPAFKLRLKTFIKALQMIHSLGLMWILHFVNYEVNGGIRPNIHIVKRFDWMAAICWQ